MARSRNIKPGFFCNEDMVELDFATRLLFAGLWTIADREGRLEDRPKKIKINVFPADDVDVEGMLVALASKKFIQRYVVNGEKYVQITNWHKHQNPHHTEKHSVIPDCNGELTVKQPLKPSDLPKRDGGNLADSLIPDSRFTDSLIPDSLTSVAKATGGKPPVSNPAVMDDKDKVFTYGVPMLVASGSTEKAARSFLGGLCKGHGDSAVVQALRDCIKAKPVEPLTWLAGALPPRGLHKQQNKQISLEERNRAVAVEWLKSQEQDDATV